MDITTVAQMEKYAEKLRYLVIFPDRSTLFYKSLRSIATDICIDYTTISRRLSEENPCICVSQSSGYIFLIRKM